MAASEETKKIPDLYLSNQTRFDLNKYKWNINRHDTMEKRCFLIYKLIYKLSHLYIKCIN